MLQNPETKVYNKIQVLEELAKALKCLVDENKSLQTQITEINMTQPNMTKSPSNQVTNMETDDNTAYDVDINIS